MKIYFWRESKEEWLGTKEEMWQALKECGYPCVDNNKLIAKYGDKFKIIKAHYEEITAKELNEIKENLCVERYDIETIEVDCVDVANNKIFLSIGEYEC